VIEHLPSKCKTLNSNPGTAKNRLNKSPEHPIVRTSKLDTVVHASPGKVIKTISRKANTNKRTGDVARVVKGLLSRREALGSSPQYCRTNKQTKNGKCRK
jgi:hypothetical protein